MYTWKISSSDQIFGPILSYLGGYKNRGWRGAGRNLKKGALQTTEVVVESRGLNWETGVRVE